MSSPDLAEYSEKAGYRGIPIFPGDLKKNDALFLYGAMQKKQPFVFCYGQDICEVVHGPSCIIPNEIYIDNCDFANVPILERRGGGGTVVLSEGMSIIVVVGFRNGRHALPIFNSIHHAMILLLDRYGIKNLEQQGISDITINNSKILGSSLYLGSKPQLYYYQSCLMVSSEIELLNRYLKHPPREPDYRNSREHSSFCTTLHNEGYAISVETINAVFREQLPDMIL
jgi:lipoate---protein ligase